MKTMQKKAARRIRRRRHVRRKVTGTPDRPRLTVFRSQKYIYVQIIDDTAGRTLVTASTREKGVTLSGSGCNTDAAKAVGSALAVKAVAAGITQVVFDRNGYAYHGRVKELADAAREAGLKF